MEFLKLFFIVAGILGLALIGLALNIILKKDGKFPNTHVGGNKFLKRKGVYCSQTQDKIEQKNAYPKSKFQKLKYIPESK